MTRIRVYALRDGTILVTPPDPGSSHHFVRLAVLEQPYRGEDLDSLIAHLQGALDVLEDIKRNYQ